MRNAFVFVLLGMAACVGPPKDHPTRSEGFELVGWHQATGRLDPTPYRARLVYDGPGRVAWMLVPKGHGWDSADRSITDAIRFYAASDRGLPDDIGRRFLWATIVPGDHEYRVLVGPKRGEGEPVSELRVIDWNGHVRTVDLDPAFWQLWLPPKHEKH